MTNPVFTIIAVRTLQASLLALLLHWGLGWPFTGPHALGLFVTPALCVYFVFVFIAPWSWGLPIVTQLPTRDNAVALTFDDGPSSETTPLILDALRAHGVSATFFVLGEAAQKYPQLVRRIAAEGHTIGLHSFHHHALTLAPWRQVRQEVRLAVQAVRAACPDSPTPIWFRPPHGFKNMALPWLVRSCGVSLVTWTVNPRDYRLQPADCLARTTLAGLRPGAIVLLHDGPGSLVTAQALPGILAGIAGAGFQCVAIAAD